MNCRCECECYEHHVNFLGFLVNAKMECEDCNLKLIIILAILLSHFGKCLRSFNPFDKRSEMKIKEHFEVNNVIYSHCLEILLPFEILSEFVNIERISYGAFKMCLLAILAIELCVHRVHIYREKIGFRSLCSGCELI